MVAGILPRRSGLGRASQLCVGLLIFEGHEEGAQAADIVVNLHHAYRRPKFHDLGRTRGAADPPGLGRGWLTIANRAHAAWPTATARTACQGEQNQADGVKTLPERIPARSE